MSEASNFDTTGFGLMNSQLQGEQEAAAEVGVLFEYVTMPLAVPLVERGYLNLFQFQQMIGNLYRNAFRSVKESGGTDGRIILIWGDTEAGYQVKMCNTGAPFSPVVLEHLGERNVTTSGGGHGLADTCELLVRCGAN